MSFKYIKSYLISEDKPGEDICVITDRLGLHRISIDKCDFIEIARLMGWTVTEKDLETNIEYEEDWLIGDKNE